MIASDFDIFAKVGGAAAYDEVTTFSIKDGQMKVNEEISDFDGMLTVQFLKVSDVHDLVCGQEDDGGSTTDLCM